VLEILTHISLLATISIAEILILIAYSMELRRRPAKTAAAAQSPHDTYFEHDVFIGLGIL
jgi:hypothetical protein